MSSELIKDEIWKTVYEARHGDLETDEATGRIIELFERAGERARSSELLARRQADEGLAKHETGKASSYVSPHRCPYCDAGYLKYSHPPWMEICPKCKGTGQRREERAERRANEKLTDDGQKDER